MSKLPFSIRTNGAYVIRSAESRPRAIKPASGRYSAKALSSSAELAHAVRDKLRKSAMSSRTGV